jgi:hypothetical protein
LVVPASAGVWACCLVVEEELWIPVAGSMASLGLLLIVLMLPWLKLGVGSGNTASKNKSATSRSSLLGFGCKMDELSTGHGGEGERISPSARFLSSSPMAGRGGEDMVRKGGPILDPGVGSCLSYRCCSCLRSHLMLSSLSYHGGDEGSADCVVAPEDLPGGCYGSPLILCVEHVASLIDAVIFGRKGSRAQPPSWRPPSLLLRKLDDALLPSGFVPSCLTTAVGRRSTPEESPRAACSCSSAATPGGRRRMVAETPWSSIAFLKFFVGCSL